MSSRPEHLVILGASARAAAFSAVRAGLRPWCIDLFADRDLRALCPARTICRDRYPHQLARMVRAAPSGPWMFTGALENHPRLLAKLRQQRPLWGSEPEAIARVRDPFELHRLLIAGGIAYPEVRPSADGLPRDGSWLVKPKAGAGGAGISPWHGDAGRPVARRYFQQRVPGEPCAAIFIGNGDEALLLGVTRQLVGEAWLHARPFAYCGSIGPLALDPATTKQLLRMGQVLAKEFRLRGLFGVDCVVQTGILTLIEVNPRYTASVEVLEHACGFGALAWQRDVFEHGSWPDGLSIAPKGRAFVGKAIYFAPERISFPAEGPWNAALESPRDVEALPEFADIPQPQAEIDAGSPVLSFFAQAESEHDCLGRLKDVAADLDRLLLTG